MDSSNDRLLESLYKFVTQELKFSCVVDIVPGLRGGLFDSRADGAAAFTQYGAPQIALDSSYKAWPREHLIYVVLHETAHHKLNHVHKAARATAQHGDVYVRNEASVSYTQRIETAADTLAKEYVKRFQKWHKDSVLADLQAQITELQQLLGIRRATR